MACSQSPSPLTARVAPTCTLTAPVAGNWFARLPLRPDTPVIHVDGSYDQTALATWSDIPADRGVARVHLAFRGAAIDLVAPIRDEPFRIATRAQLLPDQVWAPPGVAAHIAGHVWALPGIAAHVTGADPRGIHVRVPAWWSSSRDIETTVSCADLYGQRVTRTLAPVPPLPGDRSGRGEIVLGAGPSGEVVFGADATRWWGQAIASDHGMIHLHAYVAHDADLTERFEVDGWLVDPGPPTIFDDASINISIASRTGYESMANVVTTRDVDLVLAPERVRIGTIHRGTRLVARAADASIDHWRATGPDARVELTSPVMVPVDGHAFTVPSDALRALF